jgi:hypothetical protein
VVLLAALVDSLVPTVGAFTARLPANVECETASPGEVCATCSAEVEMAQAEAPHGSRPLSPSERFVADAARLDEGHFRRVFRPPIAS